jgi:Uroporphyrinogen-III decarboxylase
VTLQPVRRHDVDAAVMFADIMTPVLALGVDVELREGVGPVIDPPIRTAADVAAPCSCLSQMRSRTCSGDPHRAWRVA